MFKIKSKGTIILLNANVRKFFVRKNTSENNVIRKFNLDDAVLSKKNQSALTYFREEFSLI